MELKFTNLMPDSWLHALGATLFHSIWEGVILALLCALVMVATRKTSASVRYNFLTAILMLFVVAIAVTFYGELQKQNPTALHPKVAQETTINITAVQDGGFVSSTTGVRIFRGAERLLNILNSYSVQIVLIWFLIICAKSIQLLAGLTVIDRLRKNQVYSAGAIWEEHLGVLSNKLGLNKQVKLLQSGIAKVPMALGHAKPLILIPLGLLNNLSSTEVEAILSHELAHIKRRDFLVNLLQSFLEIIFFFNPAVCWVSQLIKTEREHCCDDLAIACIDDRKNYVKALISCQEFEQRAPAYAMGITGKKGSLLNRVSRMLLKTNSTLNKMEKTILTIALVSTVLFTAAFKGVSATVVTGNKKIVNQLIQQDTAKKMANKENKSADILEKEIEQKIKAATQKPAEMKGVKIFNNELSTQGAASNKDASKQVAIDVRQAIKDARQAQIDARQADRDAKQAKADAEQAIIDHRVAEEDAKWIAQEQVGEQIPQSVPRAPKSPKAPRPPRGAAGLISPTPLAPPLPPAAPSSVNLPAPPLPPIPPSSGKRTSKTNVERVVSAKSITNGDGHDYTSAINKELVNDQIINTTRHLSYKLNKDELIVNGIKQSDAVHKKYKNKYLKNEGHSLVYNYSIEKSVSNQ